MQTHNLLLSLVFACAALSGCGTETYVAGLFVEEIREKSMGPTPSLENTSAWKEFTLPAQTTGETFIARAKTVATDLGYQMEWTGGAVISVKKEEDRQPRWIGDKSRRTVIVEMKLAADGRTVTLAITTSDSRDYTNPWPIVNPLKERLRQLYTTAAKS